MHVYAPVQRHQKIILNNKTTHHLLFNYGKIKWERKKNCLFILLRRSTTSSIQCDSMCIFLVLLIEIPKHCRSYEWIFREYVWAWNRYSAKRQPQQQQPSLLEKENHLAVCLFIRCFCWICFCAAFRVHAFDACRFNCNCNSNYNFNFSSLFQMSYFHKVQNNKYSKWFAFGILFHPHN